MPNNTIISGSRRDFLKISLAAAALPIISLGSTLPSPTSELLTCQDGRQWWRQSRFGLFVHWGLYSIHGWQEQEQWRLGITRSKYDQLQTQWNPGEFDPDAWLDLAEAAKMKYICFTTKHHDGFCLWDTKQTDFNSVHTPYGKDVLKLLAEACHRRNFPLCLYYSVLDWHHPNYPNQGRSHEIPPQPGDSPNWEKYLVYLKAQVRELCTNYGEIHGFWWDMNTTKYQDPSVNNLIRSLQPKAVINNRGFDAGDFGTPERDYDSSVKTLQRFTTPTEACQSVGYQSWGFRYDEDYYSLSYLIRNIHQILVKGGNYLLNVGPTSEGAIPPQSRGLLQAIGHWLEPVQESLREVQFVDNLISKPGLALTRRDNTLYVHLLEELETSSVMLHPITELPKQVTLLNTGEEIKFDVARFPRLHDQVPDHGLRLKHLPTHHRSTAGWVLKLDYDRFPAPAPKILKREDTK